MTYLSKSVAIIGGTGALGLGLATRWARAGITVIIGSRDAGRASEAAHEIQGATGAAPAGMANGAAAAAAEVVALAVPFVGREAILDSIREGCQGKIVIDSTVPLMPPRVGTVTLPPGGSAAQMCQQTLGEGARVVAAFHNVAADKLLGMAPSIVTCWSVATSWRTGRLWSDWRMRRVYVECTPVHWRMQWRRNR